MNTAQVYISRICTLSLFGQKHSKPAIALQLEFAVTLLSEEKQIFLFKGTLGIMCPNVSTTPITAIGCRQCLSLSVVQLKGKHC